MFNLLIRAIYAGMTDRDEQMSLKFSAGVFGQMSRQASTWKINNLDLIIADQMIFTPSPGAGSKMISLFMTVT